MTEETKDQELEVIIDETLGELEGEIDRIADQLATTLTDWAKSHGHSIPLINEVPWTTITYPSIKMPEDGND